MQAFAEQVSEYSKSRFNITVDADSIDLTYSQTLYDAVMLYAHAATKVLSEGGDLRDGQAVTAAVRSTTFEGVGGSAVALDENGDRIESFEVMNYVVGADGSIGTVPVGKYDSNVEKYTPHERTVVWPGSTTMTPLDHVPLTETETLERGHGKTQQVIIIVLCVLFTLVLVLVGVTIHKEWREKRQRFRQMIVNSF